MDRTEHVDNENEIFVDVSNGRMNSDTMLRDRSTLRYFLCLQPQVNNSQKKGELISGPPLPNPINLYLPMQILSFS